MSGDELDRVLDQALASYSVCEPRPGLASRVLARVEAEGRRRRRSWWLWAIPALASLTILLVPMPWNPEPIRVALSVPAVPRDALAPIRTPAAPTTQMARRTAHSRERPLITLARLEPEVAQWLARPLAPLEIGPIEIRPLQIDGLETGELK